MKFRLRSALPLFVLAIPYVAHAGHKPKPDHWVATWAAAEVAVPTASLAAADPTQFIPGAVDTTIRQIVHASISTGPTPLVRLEFTNAFGTSPLTLGEVHVALADSLTGAGPHPTATSLSSPLTRSPSPGAPRSRLPQVQRPSPIPSR